MEQLKSFFPGVPEATLRTALKQAGNDPNKAAELIFSS